MPPLGVLAPRSTVATTQESREGTLDVRSVGHAPAPAPPMPPLPPRPDYLEGRCTLPREHPVYETFTYLATDAGPNLTEAHLRVAAHLRRQWNNSRSWPGRGVAESHTAVPSPLGGGVTLREGDVREGQFGHELTNRDLAVAVGKRIRWMPHRGEDFGVVEALPYVDDLGRHGWFFYGWSRVP